MSEYDFKWLKGKQAGAPGPAPGEVARPGAPPASQAATPSSTGSVERRLPPRPGEPPRPAARAPLPTRPEEARSYPASLPPRPPAPPAARPPESQRLDPETERAQALIRAAFNEQLARSQGRPPEREASASRTSAPSKGERDPDIEELLVYLDEVIADYKSHVDGIGSLGFAAPMTLYYRDEIQETLALLDVEPGVDTQPYWRRTVECDTRLKARKQDLVDEIGHANFKQYQIINDPPGSHWWWFLNKETKAPPPPVPFWQLWKRSQ